MSPAAARYGLLTVYGPALVGLKDARHLSGLKTVCGLALVGVEGSRGRAGEFSNCKLRKLTRDNLQSHPVKEEQAQKGENGP